MTRPQRPDALAPRRVMRAADALHFATGALRTSPRRSLMIVLAMAIGISAVLAFSAIGESAQRLVRAEFQQLGAELLVVLPGRTETTGGPPPLLGEAAHDLTLADAEALVRLPGVQAVVPIALGSALASARGLSREATVIGSSAGFLPLRELRLTAGSGLPAGAIDQARPVVVLGRGLAQALFPDRPALGARLRLGDRGYRVIGVIAATGVSIGLDIDEIALIPAAAALALFDQGSLFRVLVELQHSDYRPTVEAAILTTLARRHGGEADVTVIAPDTLLAVLDQLLATLTQVVSGIAALGLIVAGVLILNVMLIAVGQRRREIGLLLALGASAALIRGLFLLEAVLLSLGGAALGALLAGGLLLALHWGLPSLPIALPGWALPGAFAAAIGCGLGFGYLPASRAARLTPIEALRAP